MAETLKHEGLSKTREMENNTFANNGESSGLPAYEDFSSPAYDAVERPEVQPELNPPSEYSIFPRDIFFYHTEYISLAIGPPYEANKPQPPPIFHASIHMDKRLSNKSEIPPVRLHYGPDDTYPVIGDVRFRTSPSSDITLYPCALGSSSSASITETHIELLNNTAMIADVHFFYQNITNSSGSIIRKNFEWRHSGGPEAKALATDNVGGEDYSQVKTGLKLMDVATGEVLAVYCGGRHNRNLNPKRLGGKLRFLASEEKRGEGFRLVVVLSILCIVERRRRQAALRTASAGGGPPCIIC
ncbi:uncharacterized protein PAC_18179 [Phialocephala subalpina]|uniref:Uncharacterized protein n=1 Tax=Phialocephala subalpina TaxID=576137 RepID=A0A1L7XTB5_9HELO|nr:uncharacterized protein PAC_18179 [Phialocephala subalpina]